VDGAEVEIWGRNRENDEGLILNWLEFRGEA
jgi:hypothetical protein